MPFMSDSELNKLALHVERSSKPHPTLLRAKHHLEAKKTHAASAATAVMAASAVGFARGKMEQADGSFPIPGLNKGDAEGALGLALVAVGLALPPDPKAGMMDPGTLAMDAGTGILAHYMGQLMRKWAKTGAFSLVAGEAPTHQLVGYEQSGAYGNIGGVTDGIGAEDSLRSALAAVP